jgi:homogentisate 1,2-dioxygenase
MPSNCRAAFTAPRHENRRSWLYRMRPTADHRPTERYDGAPCSRPARHEPLPPTGCAGTRRRPAREADFVDGLVTMLANRDPAEDLEGVAVHLYRANQDMDRRCSSMPTASC